tara:strand:- start:310 stop:507 length:198 start_codon:yes stop_codon:yes gene_type:complete
MPKKYNSVLSFSFPIDHENENGSDLTGDDILEALNDWIRGMSSQEVFENTTECFFKIPLKDTIEN